MIMLHLPMLPPSANELWDRTPKGMRLSEKYRSWLHKAGLLANAQRRGQHVNGPYSLSIQAVRPDARRRDIDNLIKATSDLLVKIGAVTDDSLCDLVSARWVTSGEGIAIRVEKAGVE